jgi:hypothetical protein
MGALAPLRNSSIGYRKNVSRKVAKGMARVGFTTKITEITKGGKGERIAESLRAWRLCAQPQTSIGDRQDVSRKGAKSLRGWRAPGLPRSDEVTKGGKGERIAESWRAWRLCARAFVGLN